MKRMTHLYALLIAGVIGINTPALCHETTPAQALSGIQLAANSNSGKVFIYNPKTLHWYAYDNGELIRSGRGSGGANYCPDLRRGCRTPSGTFHIIRKGSAHCRSSIYPLGKGGARMDYCMFFSNYYAIHGSSDIKPYNASHGCVRVHIHDARWLSQHFIDIGTKVIIKPY
ncbi:MAG: endopeptidase IV [Gammaproteobacteria bacterium RIFCSPHIGHO2_12_FULL_45_9]|nr:MAG: endopeptidase IV [Gammaproteobacteria bacterium RIFCSPHIGHO2_12_FULL_45_9]